jgi:outer membrane protein assembly factor BamE
MFKKIVVLSVLLLTACVYKLDIQQGNILAQKDIDNLRPGLTKSQVIFVLGETVISDAFSDDDWIYLYTYKNANTEQNVRKKLTLKFVDDKLVSAKGDYEIPADLKAE